MDAIIPDVIKDGTKEKAEEEKPEPGQDDSPVLPEAGIAPGTPHTPAETPGEDPSGAGSGAGTDVLRSTEGGGAVLRMVQVATEGLRPINVYGTTPGVVQMSELLLRMGYKITQVDSEKVFNLFDPGTQHTAVKPDFKLKPAIESAATLMIQHLVEACGDDSVTGVAYQQVSPYLPSPFTNIYLMYDDGMGQEADELDYVKSQTQDHLHERNVIILYSNMDVLALTEALDE